MQVKIHVRTAEGSAPRIIWLFKKYVIGINRHGITKVEAFGDDANIFIEVEGTPRKVMKMVKNVQRFDSAIKMILGNKKVQKVTGLSAEEMTTLDELLKNHTECDIVKEATAQEMEDDKPFWQRMKEKYKKKFKV